jgi:O-acetyl-ADP-ribose deacetylase (regulator of RNase III)
MIELRQGDILKAQADALVNTVNCVGVMGRGIALQFAKAFPDMLRGYQALCKRGGLSPGMVQVYDLNHLGQPRYVINFPTKRHWKGKSRLEDIRAGLPALVAAVRRLGVGSVAVPPLGCGLGGLDWDEVRPLIIQAFEAVPDVRVLLFEPGGAPSPAAMARQQAAPRMTEGRAALLALMGRYLAAVMDPWVSLLEIHKLMYFMQESGQSLRLQFTKGVYGPYAENLRHVLSHIEGHFITGYGDAEDDPTRPIEPMGDGLQRAEDFLSGHPVVRQHLERVASLIEGFETPYGMELLATVHWVATREYAATPEKAAEAVHRWNTRKQMFRLEHVRIAWQTLEGHGWLGRS